MFPWKLIFRFFSAVVLMATGGFAAGHDLPVPFDTSSTPAVAAPAPDPVTTTTTEAPAVDDSTTTTTTAPDSPVVVDGPGTDPAPTTTTTTEPAKPADPAKPAPSAPLKPVPAPAVPDPAPVPPVDGDAPAVCAAAQTAACAPVAPTAADSHAARVQRCQDWWNSLADAFTAHNRPEWAARAKELAGRCDEFVTRWEQWQQKWADWQARHPKGDHNHDGHPDNGKAPKHDGDHPAPPPPAQPQARQVSRHGEGRH